MPTSPRTRLRRAISCAALVLAAFPSAALAATQSADGSDASGDGPAPGRDIVALHAAYDSSGQVTATVTLAGTPDASTDAFAFVGFGTKAADGTCGGPKILGIGGNTASGAAGWSLLDGGANPQGSATRSLSGNALTLTANDARFAGGTYDCVLAQLDQKGASTVYDETPTIALPPPAASPPSTQTAPTTTTPAPQPAPAPSPAPTPQPKPTPTPTPAPKAPKLSLSISGVPKTITRNRTLRLKVRATNRGTAATSKLRLHVVRKRGLSVSPAKKTLSAIKAGKGTTWTVRVRLTRHAATATRFDVRASGSSKLSAAAAVTLRIGRAKAPSGAKTSSGTPATPRSPLAGTYWWFNINHPTYAWDNHGLAFIDDTWAYMGFPPAGLQGCTQVTLAADKDGNMTGCVKYTYDAKTGAVTVGTQSGTFSGGALKLGDQAYTPLAIPSPGAHYDVKLLHRSFNGLCGPYSTCTTSLKTLTLTGAGQFALGASTTATSDSATAFVAGGSYPPDEYGTYTIGQHGQIHLAYANGTQQDFTIGISLNKAGQPDPVNEGVLLGEDNFYTEPD